MGQPQEHPRSAGNRMRELLPPGQARWLEVLRFAGTRSWTRRPSAPPFEDPSVREVDEPREGGLSMIERLTEIAFVELLLHQLSDPPQDAVFSLCAACWFNQSMFDLGRMYARR